MHYRMLLWPHANARYQSETLKLATAELELMLARLAPGAEIAADERLGMPCLDIRMDEPLDAAALGALRRHSLLYGLFEDENGLLRPVAGRGEAAVGRDLPAILKYKGKTNELFLQLLVNVALYAGDYWREGGPLSMLDPMCGRATGLFVAANYGWNALGADVDRGDLKEAEQFFRRYLEYHRFKHTVTRLSRTLNKGGSAAECRFEYAPQAHDPKRALSLVCLDAAHSGGALGKNAFHLIACDLPYGVRHDAQLERGQRAKGNWLEALLEKALPDWRAALKPGGAMALSFNAQNMKLERLRALMEGAGLEVLSGGACDGFAHWVEQAITRDIAVCRKPL